MPSPIAISFGIKTNRKKEWKLVSLVASILAQGLPADSMEILITGDTDFSCLDGRMAESVRLIPDPDSAADARISIMLNRLAREAAHPWICLCDDDIVLCDGWYEKVCHFIAEHPDVMACTFPLRNPDGSRCWDWSIHVDGRSALIDPGTPSPHLYLTGGIVMIRREVWDAHKWNESLRITDHEDVEWSQRVLKAGLPAGLCTAAYVLHNDWRYWQLGPGVKCSKDVRETIAVADRPMANAAYRRFLVEAGRSLASLSAALNELRWGGLPSLPTEDKAKLAEIIQALGVVEAGVSGLGEITKKLGDYAG